MKNLINSIQALLQLNKDKNQHKNIANHNEKQCNYADNYYGDQKCK